jgi:hypothetical protein
MKRTATIGARKAQPAISLAGNTFLQRKYKSGEHQTGGKREQCWRMDSTFQRSVPSTGEPAAVPPIVHEVLRSSGQALDSGTRAFMEPRLGHDFSQVRVHSDERASDSARMVGALAYTVGRDIVFGQGRPSLQSREGHRLLAHELVHVIQQQDQDPACGQRIELTPADGPCEREASTVAAGVLSDAGSNSGELWDLSRSGIALSRSPEEGETRRRPIRGMVAPGEIPVRRPPASQLIPDLDQATVEEILTRIRYGQSVEIRQGMIRLIVADRQRKGDNFHIMDRDEPRYVATYPPGIPGDQSQSNGITVPSGQIPECSGGRPCVYIGPTAFGGTEAEERVVRVYSSVMHELQHARQWQQPAAARALGSHGREVEAFFWEIENASRTGLLRQPGPLQSVWQEASNHWRAFLNSPEWRRLSAEQQRAYRARFERVSAIVRQASRRNP